MGGVAAIALTASLSVAAGMPAVALAQEEPSSATQASGQTVSSSSLTGGDTERAADAVASIGDKEYTSLNEAFKYAKDGQTVKVLADTILTGDVEISDGSNVVLDLGDKSVETDGHHFNIAGGLTVSGSGAVVNSVAGTGKDYKSAHTVFYVDGGSLTVSSGAYETKSSMLIVVVKGVATVNGGSFKATGTTTEIGSVNGTALVRVDGSESKLNINAGTFVADALDSNKGVALYGVYGSNGAEMTFGTKDGAIQPSITSGYSAIGLNNTTSSPAVAITVNSGTYKAGLGADGAGKFSSVMYLSGTSKVTIDGGEFIAADSSVHLLSLPYKSVGVDLSIDGGSFDAAKGKDVLYFEGGTGASGKGENKVSISDGDFNGELATFKASETHKSFVSGGSFGAELPTSLIAKDSAMLVDENGSASVMTAAEAESKAGAAVEKDGKTVYYTTEKAATDANPDAGDDAVKVYVASVDGKKYESVSDAIKAADGKTVTLVADTQDNITVPAGTTVTLDLAGHTLSGGTVSGKAAITNNGTLTLKDSSEQGTGRVIREDNGQPSYYVIDNQGMMTVESGTVYNNSGDHKNGSSLVRNGGVKNKAVLDIKGGIFEQEKFIVIKNDDYGTLNMTAGTIKTGKPQVIGGVEYTPSGVQNWGQATLSGGVVEGAVWTSAWSDNLDTPKTVISGNAHIQGSIILDRYSSKLSTVPGVSIESGTFDVDEWKIEDDGVSLEVSGGTFAGEPPADEFIVPGSGLVKDEHGNYVTVDAELVFASDEVAGGVYTYDVRGGKADPVTEADLLKLVSTNVTGYTVSVDASALPTLNKAIGAADTSTEFSFKYIAAKDGAQAGVASGVAPLTLTVRLIDSEAELKPEPEPAQKATVTFDTGLGSSFTREVAVGSRLERPADPERDGWEFAGWFTVRNADGTLSGEWDFDTGEVEGDMTLYGGWVRKGSSADAVAGSGSQTGLPQTGDDSALSIAVAGAAGAAAIAAGAVALKRRGSE